MRQESNGNDKGENAAVVLQIDAFRKRIVKTAGDDVEHASFARMCDEHLDVLLRHGAAETIERAEGAMVAALALHAFRCGRGAEEAGARIGELMAEFVTILDRFRSTPKKD
jgi:hypothetical protein